MWFQVKIISCFIVLIITAVAAEPARRKSAPYPASGWRPKKPFNLPGEYLPPTDVEQQQQEPQTVLVEINKERVDYAGQIADTQPLQVKPQQNNIFQYDADSDYFNSNALPNKNQPNFITQTQQQQPQNPFTPNKPITMNNPNAPFFPTENPNSKPAATYGAPDILNTAYPDPRSAAADPDDSLDTVEKIKNDQENRNAIKTLNAAVDDYNRARAADAKNNDDDINVGLFSQGQYFILGPDNTVQRVMFTTTQTEQEANKNGFTAELKYTPVGEIRDPVFKYNNEGQLVRIF